MEMLIHNCQFITSVFEVDAEDEQVSYAPKHLDS